MNRIALTETTIAELEKLSDDWALSPQGWTASEAFIALERVGLVDKRKPAQRWQIRRTPHGRAALGLPPLKGSPNAG